MKMSKEDAIMILSLFQNVDWSNSIRLDSTFGKVRMSQLNLYAKAVDTLVECYEDN